MIETLLAHRDAIPYALAVGCIVLATAMGYLLGSQDEAEICAPHLIESERLRSLASEQNEKLTRCESKGAGAAALNCSTVCAKQVSTALKNHTDIVCED